jgi:single-stranded-DNA-specific exonuclease
MLMSRWLNPAPVEVPDEFRKAVGGHPLIAETLTRRGITTIEAARAFLDPKFYQPADPFDLPDMVRAVERAVEAVRNGERVLIWGDFDVDGQTATTLLVSIFDKLGLRVDYYIPDRQTEGHGIHTGKLRSLISELSLNLVITCDTGISAHDAIDFANQHGVDVIVTDHHQLPDKLPNAFANINPQQLAEDHPLATLPGVGCAYLFAQALYTTLESDQALLRDELDLVALGIVADVAVQKGDTRYLLQCGLSQLRQTPRLGLQALFRNAGFSPETLDESDISFSIAPRLNSLGRLSDANQAVELLTTTDQVRAELIANRLEAWNSERKFLEKQVFESAVKQIDQDNTLLNEPVLVLSHAGWANGVLGIAANRLVETYKRPAILLNIGSDRVARGSARSVEGIDIIDAIASCSQYLNTYGGHTMAAGLSLSVENIPALRRGLRLYLRDKGVTGIPSLSVADAELRLSDISLELINDVRRLAPFGAGNPPLSFVTRSVRVVDQRPIGRDESHLRWIVSDGAGETREVTRWRTSKEETPQGLINLYFSLRENVYKGSRELLIEYLDSVPVETDDSNAFSGEVEIIDWRAEKDKAEKLSQFLMEHEALVWCEGEILEGISTVNRSTLSRSKTLVLWNVPPSRSITRQIIEAVQPQKIIITGQMPANHDLETVLKRIAGAIRYAVRQYQGVLDVLKVAASIAQTRDFVQAALSWFAARGDITISHLDGIEHPVVTLDDAQQDDDRKRDALVTLTQLYEEADAYRSYFMRSSVEKILEV